MKTRTPNAVLALSFVLALGTPGLSLAQTPSHSGHDTAPLGLVLNNGAKWQGDRNMILGMTAIRDIVAANLDAIHRGSLTADAAQSIAADVGKQVDFMIETCVLEPEVDAQLHSVLAQIADGASGLEAGEVEAGGMKMVQALNAYGEHFEHPGWQKLE